MRKKTVYKAIHRLFRIFTLRRGLYGKTGRGNIVKFGTIIDENSIVGNYNYFGKNVMITAAKIGNYNSIAPNVTIGPGEHDYHHATTRLGMLEINEELTTKPVEIESDVWIGTGAIVLRGVKIGTGAIVAAGAVVNRNVEPYTIVGGVPAKVLKLRFDRKIVEKLLESQWWDKDYLDAKKTVQDMEKIIMGE